jgi:hypothetical protein
MIEIEQRTELAVRAMSAEQEELCELIEPLLAAEFIAGRAGE